MTYLILICSVGYLMHHENNNDVTLDFVIAKHKQYLEKCKAISFAVNGISSNNPKAQYVGIKYYMYNSNEMCVNINKDTIKMKNMPIEEVICKNDNYIFSLTKKTSNSDYIVVYHSAQQSEYSELRGSILDKSLFSPIDIYSCNMIDGSGSSLVVLSQPERLDDATYKIRVSRKLEKESVDNSAIDFEGFIIVDPAHDFLITREELKLSYRNKGLVKSKPYIKKIKYLKNEIGVMPEVIELKWQPSLEMKHEDSEAWKITDYLRTTKVPSDFRLTAFGFPEPKYSHVESKLLSEVPWFVMLSIVGIICLLLASWILYRRNKQAAS